MLGYIFIKHNLFIPSSRLSSSAVLESIVTMSSVSSRSVGEVPAPSPIHIRVFVSIAIDLLKSVVTIFRHSRYSIIRQYAAKGLSTFLNCAFFYSYLSSLFLTCYILFFSFIIIIYYFIYSPSLCLSVFFFNLHILLSFCNLITLLISFSFIFTFSPSPSLLLSLSPQLVYRMERRASLFVPM